MEVIGEEQAAWFLLKESDEYYLDVNSGRSFVGYAICFRLNDQEIAAYHSQGSRFISQLSKKVNDTQEPFLNREQEVRRDVRESMHHAVLEWNAEKQP